ncbi:MAG TPA: diacylglycerol kinase family protein, partial [Thermoanaerobaculia bacterium]|nr:diacylglycerol kinase family protein [Thermoanaerobaculia bacterium]
MTRVLLVVNPIAGGGRAASLAAELERSLASNGTRVEIHLTSLDEEPGALAAALSGVSVVVAVGGDGTLNRVVRSVVLSGTEDGTGPAIGLLPCGTGNVAARAFGLPRRTSDLASAVAGGATRSVDVGVVARNGAPAGVFLLWLGAGLDAALIQHVASRRAGVRGMRLV